MTHSLRIPGPTFQGDRVVFCRKMAWQAELSPERKEKVFQALLVKAHQRHPHNTLIPCGTKKCLTDCLTVDPRGYHLWYNLDGDRGKNTHMASILFEDAEI